MSNLDEKSLELLRSWYTIRNKKKVLDKELSSLEKELKDLKETIIHSVFKGQPGKVAFDDKVVEHVVVEATRIDTTRLQKEMPNVAKEYRVSYSYSLLDLEEDLKYRREKYGTKSE